MEVGIPAPSATINLHCPEDNSFWDEDARRHFRSDARKFFSTYFDEPAVKIGVWFSDECPDCGKVVDLETRKCDDPKCLSNLPPYNPEE
jgi:hypothetical protein